MSLAARASLVASSHVVFQAASQRTDLLNANVTQTELIALLLELVAKGFHFEVTAVKTDHHDDSSLGLHCHTNGYAIDLWPLADGTPGNYVDASTQSFRDFLGACAASPWLWQIGLVGDGADSPENFAAAGHTAYQDDGGAHVHLGANG